MFERTSINEKEAGDGSLFFYKISKCKLVSYLFDFIGLPDLPSSSFEKQIFCKVMPFYNFNSMGVVY